ncbi:hypothetical protein HY065_00070 [Candidatus Berkelbacteria bacterium]|nr:hypothetical protein [Candidatus Berkelbacteria bacterium]
MEKEPKFIKDFSKDQSSEERDELAKSIRGKRSEYFSKKNERLTLGETLKSEIQEREVRLNQELERIRELDDRIEMISSSGFLNKILNYFELNKLRADNKLGKKTYEQLQTEQNQLVKQEKFLTDKTRGDTPEELKEAKELLQNFYADQKKKWERSPHTKDEITKYFSQEHLAKLSLNEYTLLLKRFPSEMVAHVTRQGIRDHVGHMWHSAGEGAYSDSFMKMLGDGRLRSPLAVHMMENTKKDAIAEFLRLENFDTKEKALAEVNKIIDPESQGQGSYADAAAIHFATEEVADSYYGSEKGNEIFVAFPSALIASQYYFNGQLNERGGGYWNDQWVWANEDKGIDLNTGLVFIPEDAKVDPKNGSRYELDETKNPIVNEQYRQSIRKVVESNDFNDFADQAREISGKLRGNWENEINRDIVKKIEPFRQRLASEFGITDSRLQYALLSHHSLLGLSIQKEALKNGREDPIKNIDSEISEILKNAGILYQEATYTISGKEFWEDYFMKHPKHRPSKIIYYKGGDPTAALHNWRESVGLRRKSEERDLEFKERSVARESSQATIGIERFQSIAQEVIEEYFDSRMKLAA